MNGIDDIRCKRTILSTLTLRFSPQIQPIKETIIEKIIEQILLIFDSERGLSLQEIQDVLSSEIGGPRINLPDIENSLKRLVERVRINIVPEGKQFRLSEEARGELADMQRHAEMHFSSVVNKLFKNARGGASVYTTPFLKFLCIVFSQLGEESARLIKGDLKVDELLSSPFVPFALKDIKKEFDSIDH
jgi:hypothetical protein